LAVKKECCTCIFRSDAKIDEQVTQRSNGERVVKLFANDDDEDIPNNNNDDDDDVLVDFGFGCKRLGDIPAM
jgi:hypothetical protein